MAGATAGISASAHADSYGAADVGPVAVAVSQSSRSPGQLIASLPQLEFTSPMPATSGPQAPTEPTIVVDDQRQFQPIWGVGAAVTNSSAFLLEHALPPTERSAVLTDLFDPLKDHLSLVRISIGGSDFNAGGRRYSEDDLAPGHTDPHLRHFTLKHDDDTIAVLRDALRINPDLKIVASSWTAPAWMKSNHSLANRGFRGTLEPKYYASYASYFVRFIEGYRAAGIPIFAVTVQNEPVKVPASYEGMSFPPQQAGRFIRRFLSPSLRRAGLSTLIFGTDESWNQASYATAEDAAAPELSGQAWHCYQGNPDTTMPRFGSLRQIMSECAPSLIRAAVSPLMTNIFNDGANAGLLWNVALTPDGGPVVPPDQGCPYCRGVLYINPTTHHVSFTPSFFQLGQFGRYIQAGARRIAATRLGHFLNARGSDRATPGLHDVAIRNPDGSDVLIVFNNGNRTLPFRVSWHALRLESNIPPAATMSLRWAAG